MRASPKKTAMRVRARRKVMRKDISVKKKAILSKVTSMKMKATLDIATSTNTTAEVRKDQKRSLNPKDIVPSLSLDPSFIPPTALQARASLT